MSKIRKRLSLLLVLIVILVPSLCFASSSSEEPKIIVTMPQIEFYNLPCMITTTDNLFIDIYIPYEYQVKHRKYGYNFCIRSYDINFDYKVYEDSLRYDDEYSKLYHIYGGETEIHVANRMIPIEHIIIPIAGKILSKDVTINVELWDGGINSAGFNFANYVTTSSCTTSSCIETTHGFITTTSASIKTEQNSNIYPDSNISSSVVAITSSQSNSSDDSSYSDDDLSDNNVIENSVTSKEEITCYLSKDEVEPQKVEFKDIAPSSEEADLISKLSEKGIISQVGETFDIKKELSIDESFTYLAKLLVVNDAVDSKLSNEVIEKYLDPKDENFAFVATVGSMLKEDTLKTVSEAEEMTRELFAEVLNEVTSLELSYNEVPFVDIEESPYKEALEYCYNAGVLIGTSENTMSPEKIITNGQMLQVLSRLDEKLSKEEAE